MEVLLVGSAASGAAGARLAGLVALLRGQGHRLGLVLAPPAPLAPAEEAALRALLPDPVLVPWRGRAPRGRRDGSFARDDWWSRDLRRAVAEALARGPRDALLVLDPLLSAALDLAPEGTARLLDLGSADPRRSLAPAEEAAALARADLAFAATDEDRLALEERSAAPVATLALPSPVAARVLASPAAIAAAAARPRALLVTDLPAWREGAGNLARIAELARLARGHMDLDLLALKGVPGEEAVAAQRLVGARGQVFAPDPAKERLPESQPRLSRFERDHYVAAWLGALEARLAATRYDVVIVQYLRLAWLRHAKGLPAATAIDLHDLVSLREENFVRFGAEPGERIDLQAEASLLAGFPFLLAIQEAEHRLLETLFPGRVLHLPHTLPPLPAADTRRPVRRIAFLGSDSPMNRTGLAWFVEQVWPAIRAPGVELHVAGAVADRLAPGLPGVVPHGRVADPAEFLRRADIAVNPVFFGGGLKIKTVEYLAHGLPLVATAEAVWGIPPGDEPAWLLARSRAEFIAALDRLIHDGALRAALGAAARDLARRRFGRAAAAPALAALVAAARSGLR
jgi:glycosyltransferase involved in cell wall biosynthesis